MNNTSATFGWSRHIQKKIEDMGLNFSVYPGMPGYAGKITIQGPRWALDRIRKVCNTETHVSPLEAVPTVRFEGDGYYPPSRLKKPTTL